MNKSRQLKPVAVILSVVDPNGAQATRSVQWVRMYLRDVNRIVRPEQFGAFPEAIERGDDRTREEVFQNLKKKIFYKFFNSNGNKN